MARASRSIHLAHAAGTERGDDLKGSKTCTGREHQLVFGVTAPSSMRRECRPRHEVRAGLPRTPLKNVRDPELWKERALPDGENRLRRISACRQAPCGPAPRDPECGARFVSRPDQPSVVMAIVGTSGGSAARSRPTKPSLAFARLYPPSAKAGSSRRRHCGLPCVSSMEESMGTPSIRCRPPIGHVTSTNRIRAASPRPR